MFANFLGYAWAISSHMAQACVAAGDFGAAVRTVAVSELLMYGSNVPSEASHRYVAAASVAVMTPRACCFSIASQGLEHIRVHILNVLLDTAARFADIVDDDAAVFNTTNEGRWWELEPLGRRGRCRLY